MTSNKPSTVTRITVNDVKKTFSNPIAFISLIVPTTFKAFVKFPVLANLHSAMVVAKKKIIDMITPNIGTIHNCKITPKKKDTIDGRIK